MRRFGEQPDPFTMEELMAPFPGDEFYLDTGDGTRLRTIADGSGPPIVFAHGLRVTSTEWNLIAERVRQNGHRVVGFDQRGHGGSTIGSDGIGSQQMASDYAAVLEHYDITDGVLVGHSMGAFLAIQFLLDHPELAAKRLKGVVLVSPFAGDLASGSPMADVQVALSKSGASSFVLRNPVYGTLFASALFGTKAPSQLEACRRELSDHQDKALSAIFEAFFTESNYGRLAEVDLPVRIICGTADLATPPEHAERVAAGIPGATLTWVDGAGHALNWEAIHEVIGQIEHFDSVNA